MGKKRINQLLEQLETNHQQDLQNAASIFTVAQVAVNKLQEQNLESVDSSISVPSPSPLLLDKSILLQRYGSYNNCRKAAAKQGIKFKRNPKWSQLVAAFSYLEAFQQVVKSYLQIYPNSDLGGTSIELRID
jgi:hypothetical protein